MDGARPEKLIEWGYTVATSSDDCISAINAYHRQFMTYGRDRGIIVRACAEDQDCVLANTLAASFLSSSNHSYASSHLASARARLEHATAYEKAVFDTVEALMAEDRDDDVVLDLHAKLLKEFPRDLVSLKKAQLLCFYMGRPDLSLQLVEQVLPQNQQQDYIYGMLAFPLLELGRMAEAEQAARKGLDINKQDLWSQHCLCHVLQNECHFKEAVEFMEECSSSWNSCSSFMYTHNWWHVALCYLEGNSPISKVVEVYDQHIWKELQRTDADCAEVCLNALGLFLRLDVRGIVNSFGDRLKTLTNCVEDKSTWNREWLLDLLALWALAACKETSKAEDLLQGMKSRINVMSKKKQHLMQRVILLAEALLEFGRRNYEQAYELLGPNFDAIDYKMAGASDEQLDVFNEVWYLILLNTGHFSRAIKEIEKQVQKREGIPFLWRLLEKAYSMERMASASVAAEKAKALECAYFAQMD